MRRLIIGGVFLAVVAAVLVIIEMDHGVRGIKLQTESPEQQQKVMKSIKKQMTEDQFNDFLESLTIALTAKELKYAQEQGTSPDPKMDHARAELDGMTVGEVIEFAKPYVEGAKAKRVAQSQKREAITVEIQKVRLVEDDYGYDVPQTDIQVDLSGKYAPTSVEVAFKIGDQTFTDFIETEPVIESGSGTVTHTLDLLEPAIGDIVKSPGELEITEVTRFWEDGQLNDMP